MTVYVYAATSDPLLWAMAHEAETWDEASAWVRAERYETDGWVHFALSEVQWPWRQTSESYGDMRRRIGR